METEREGIAFEVAMSAHVGQVDKRGEDYVGHLERVAALGESEEERVLGLLHDVVEDTEMALGDLEELGFSSEIVDAVDAITKRDGEEYGIYLERVSENELARAVKLNDIQDNTDVRRLDGLDEELRERLALKYEFALEYLCRVDENVAE